MDTIIVNKLIKNHMISIKADFKKEMESQPVGGCVALANAVRNKKYSRDVISKNMNKLLVVGEDYQKEDRKDILEHLFNLSNPFFVPEELKIKGKNVGEASSIIKGVVSTEKKKKICR